MQSEVAAQPLRDYMERIRAETGAPGVSVAVVVDGEIVFSEGVGVAEMDNRTPATGRTVHNAGSVSKVIATAGLMKLVEEGRVDLDVPIQTYLPWYPERPAGAVTLRGILTHTSGIRHYRSGEFGTNGDLERRHYDGFEEATRIWRDDPLVFAPGEFWNYSSHAFNLLHGVVEAVTARDFETFLRVEVWEPAGMSATSFDVPWRVVPKRGQGYVRDADGRLRRPDYADVSYKYAGGGILSTVEDLARFGRALNDGTLLGPEAREEMYRSQLASDILDHDDDGDHRPLEFRQGLAWRLDTDPQGRQLIYHTGTVSGTRSFIGNDPERGVVVTLQANVLPFDSERYGRAILQMVLSAAGAATEASSAPGPAASDRDESLAAFGGRVIEAVRYQPSGSPNGYNRSMGACW